MRGQVVCSVLASIQPRRCCGFSRRMSYLVISGGTGANSIASAFGTSPAFVLPVSDDGGSSAEILRCFGGPSIGDIRSRLIRLIPCPEDPQSRSDVERAAIYNLMAYRFPSDSPERIGRDLWLEIVEGRSELWDGIGEDKKECLRAFFVHFQTLALKRAHKRFSFRNFSLGNGFLTGARDLFGSLPSAIFLFKSIAGVDASAQVIPVINTNQTVTIAATLENGDQLVGQCNISHPVAPSTPRGTSLGGTGLTTPAQGTLVSALGVPTPSPTRRPDLTGRAGLANLKAHLRRDSRTFDLEIQSPAVSHPPSRSSLDINVPPVLVETGVIEDEVEVDTVGMQAGDSNIGYQKGGAEIPLQARIERIFYINLYGQEIFPEPNPEFLESLRQRDILVYSCGSLYTSIMPCLALRGLASAISSSPSLKAKVVLLNSGNDRETPDYKASDYVTAITTCLKRFDRSSRGSATSTIGVSKLVTHVVHLEGASVEIDREQIEAMGVQLVQVPRDVHLSTGPAPPLFTPDAVLWAMERIRAPLA